MDVTRYVLTLLSLLSADVTLDTLSAQMANHAMVCNIYFNLYWILHCFNLLHNDIIRSIISLKSNEYCAWYQLHFGISKLFRYQ